MAKAGLTISLATDGSGSNNCQDMLESLKFGALLQKVAARDASVVNAQTALDWATRGGAQALGRFDEIGSLEPGKRADFVLLDAESVEHWLYHLRPNAAVGVYADGRRVA